MMDLFAAYPIAAVSALLSYSLFLLFLLPGRGAGFREKIAHPIPATQQYLTGFDSLRGIAASFVALAHLWWFPYPATRAIQLDISSLAYVGNKAVPMFVMLSGFLIYRSVRNIDSVEKIRSYVYRRFFRIFPLYLASVIGIVMIGQMESRIADYGSFNFFVSELFMFRALGAPAFSNPPAWSLYVEVVFYAFIPLYVIAIPRRWIIGVSVLLAIALVTADQMSIHIREFSLWKYFFFGIAASELALRDPASKRVGATIFWIGAVWLLFDLHGPSYDILAKAGITTLNGAGYTIGLGFAFSFVLFGMKYVPRVARALNVFPLRYIGVISYSIFLIHPFYVVANFPEMTLLRFSEQRDLWGPYPEMPSWFFVLVYAPGLLIWCTATFVLIEKPALELSKNWLKGRAAATREELAAGVRAAP